MLATPGASTLRLPTGIILPGSGVFSPYVFGRRVTVATDVTTPDENAALAVQHKISAAQLSDVSSFDDALRLMEETYGADALVLASDVLGDGFTLLENKDQLIGVPAAFISWRESLGDFGPFIAARVVTQDGRKVVILDGSTGIYAQLSEFSQKFGRDGGLIARNGLRRSDYEKEMPDPKTGELVKRPASTYYIDTTA